MHLPTPVAIYLSTRVSERNSAWLFYVLKGVGGNKRRFSLDEICAAAPEFTRKQVQKHLKTLTNISWVGLDRNGVYHLRGLNFLLKSCGDCNSCLSVSIPDCALSSKKAWTDFVFSVAITQAGRQVMHWTNRKIVDNTSLLRKIPADQPMGKDVKIALSVIAMYSGMSKAAAYRARKRAGASHLNVQRIWVHGPGWVESGGKRGTELVDGPSVVTIMDCTRVRGARPSKSSAVFA